jgi:hypothetical protein
MAEVLPSVAGLALTRSLLACVLLGHPRSSDLVLRQCLPLHQPHGPEASTNPRPKPLCRMADHNQRGLDFQPWLRELFALHDLEPGGSFASVGEQIDGSIRTGRCCSWKPGGPRVSSPPKVSETDPPASIVQRVRPGPASFGDVFELYVTLRDIEPAIWRRVRVPADAPLDVLHEVLQVALGWKNYHLHEFLVGNIRFSVTELVASSSPC